MTSLHWRFATGEVLNHRRVQIQTLASDSLTVFEEIQQGKPEKPFVESFPEEILLLIVRRVLDARACLPRADINSWDAERHPAMTMTGYVRPLLKLTHVCSLWRSIIVAASSLWFNVDALTLSEPLLALFLARTATAPLTLVLRYPPRGPHAGDSIYLSHAAQVRNLQVQMSGSKSDQAPSFFPLGAPNIESLSVAFTTISSDIDFPPSLDSPYLFQEGLSGLRALSLSPFLHSLLDNTS